MRGEDSAKALMARCAQATTDNEERRARAILFGSLFEGCTLTTFNGVGYDLVSSQAFKLIETPIIRNTLRSIVMTLLSKLFCIESPLPKAMSDGGDWNQRSKAEDIDQFLECEFGLPQGEFNNSDDLWNQAGMISMAAVGSAAVVVSPGWDQVEMQLDDTLNMGVDRTGRWGAPRTVVRTAWADPEEMVFANLRKHKQAILESVETVEDPLEATRMGRGMTGKSQRQVRYFQGWRCRVRGRDGRRMVVLKNGTVLEDRPYTRKEPPVVLFHWERQLAGDWGTPHTQTVFEEVLRQNERLADVDDLVANSPGALLLAPKQVQSQLGQARGWQRCETDFPEKIKIAIPEKLDRQALELAKEHELGAHNAAGVNQAQTSASKAKGTQSGLHEDLVAHLFSERFADQQRRLTFAKVEATSRRFLWAAQDMVEAGRTEFIRQWRSKDGKTYRKLNVADLDLDDSRYVFTIAAVSEDKNRPETRAKKADDYLRLNMLTGAEWLQTQKDLDVDSATKLSNGQYEWVESQIKKWTREPLETMPDIYRSPTHWLDPKAAGKQAQLAKLTAEDAGCPEERLAWFDKFMDECVVLARKQALDAASTGQALPGTTQTLQAQGPQQ
jgi:hypothetical protein